MTKSHSLTQIRREPEYEICKNELICQKHIIQMWIQPLDIPILIQVYIYIGRDEYFLHSVLKVWTVWIIFLSFFSIICDDRKQRLRTSFNMWISIRSIWWCMISISFFSVPWTCPCTTDINLTKCTSHTLIWVVSGPDTYYLHSGT